MVWRYDINCHDILGMFLFFSHFGLWYFDFYVKMGVFFTNFPIFSQYGLIQHFGIKRAFIYGIGDFTYPPDVTVLLHLFE